MKRLLFFLLAACCFGVMHARENVEKQNRCVLELRIVDAEKHQPLGYATVLLKGAVKSYTALSDDDGKVFIKDVVCDTYKITVSYLGYDTYSKEVALNGNLALTIRMKSFVSSLQEVVVTAYESKSMGSTSVINKKAMNHLQPSSFSDLMELLPGGYARNPSLTTANLIEIRAIGVSDADYKTSSLGTAFVVDGVPMSTNANMQYTTGGQVSINGGRYVDGARSTVNRGVDMRAISTDQIERVEVVRGIPSVKYGDLTSGLVKIERKRGEAGLTARFKVDGDSKLLSMSKGFDVGDKKTFNMDFDVLDAKSEPTDRYQNYKRVNSSLRYFTSWLAAGGSQMDWEVNFDYGHTADNVKTDPDTGYELTDRYKSAYNRLALGNRLAWSPGGKPLLKKVELTTSVTYESDQIKQVKFVQLTSPTVIPDATQQGVSDGVFLPANWISSLKVDGRPLALFTQLMLSSNFNTGRVVHDFLYGAEWTYDKNFGRGQVYDVMRPPAPDMSTRPRRYSDIPAENAYSFFAEDDFNVLLRKNKLRITVGVRGMGMLGMNTDYRMSRKVYFDPRIQGEWTFPFIPIAGKDLVITVAGGLGWQRKNPTLNQLYPDYVYNDLVQLNYYSDVPEYRRMNIMTYKNRPVNYNLEPARNRKWEVRLNVSYRENNFSATYFREVMKNGFREQVTTVQSQTYKKYDQSAIHSSGLTGPPDLTNLPYANDTVLTLLSTATNGSLTRKEGIEFTFSSRRLESLKTRLTITGAWLRTTYNNSIPVYRKPAKVLAGRQMQEVGIYGSVGGYQRERFNTNFMLDTYIPSLDFEFSTSFQCIWFSQSRTTPYTMMPESYINLKGEVLPYTEAERNDTRLQWLYSPVNASAFKTERIPLGINVNFKMSKKFNDLFVVSLFVNRLLDYHPDYESNGVTIRRSVSPYFGAELKLNI